MVVIMFFFCAVIVEINWPIIVLTIIFYLHCKHWTLSCCIFTDIKEIIVNICDFVLQETLLPR